MTFIQYPKCSTCNKAKKWLDDNKIIYNERHIVEDNPNFDELKKWHKNSGLDIKRFFNTSGILYRQMQLKDRLPEMTEIEKLKLLSSNGMLVKRPIVVTKKNILIGFKIKEWEEKLLSD